MASLPPPPPPPYSKDGPSQIELFLTCQPEPCPCPIIPAPINASDLEKGIYSLDSTCDTFGVIIASIPRCLGEYVCLSWTQEGCCGTDGGCDEDEPCFLCCSAGSDVCTTVGLVGRDVLTLYKWKWARGWVLGAVLFMVLVWLVGKGRVW